MRSFNSKVNFDFECENCGKYFPAPNNRKYCSDECRMLATNNQQYDSVSYKWLRFNIFKRDEFRCVYCGKSPMIDKITLHMDHVLPKSKGGPDKPYNLVASCDDCNLAKSDIKLTDKLCQEIWERNDSLNDEFMETFECKTYT